MPCSGERTRSSGGNIASLFWIEEKAKEQTTRSMRNNGKEITRQDQAALWLGKKQAEAAVIAAYLYTLITRVT
jgi:hypothetical protein